MNIIANEFFVAPYIKTSSADRYIPLHDEENISNEMN